MIMLEPVSFNRDLIVCRCYHSVNSGFLYRIQIQLLGIEVNYYLIGISIKISWWKVS